MTILNRETITIISTPWFWATLALGLITFGMGACIVFEEEMGTVRDRIGIVLMVFGVMFTLFGPPIMGTEKHERIEAIITDDLSATELLENYTVIEQRGDIWVLGVKETE